MFIHIDDEYGSVISIIISNNLVLKFPKYSNGQSS
ncbi:hypothetical protein B6N60_01644 [Richelia sinica FACHB-800]|uniref:Uncharacterized protein n=1 Tax=Richelia sinica FACHB-800 TaxID=1357546 RepID=A0A975T6C5_9NOST|nr:hypothetical protein B6N60_01644 [Richelia sinica FACHB-800]